jgi:hypothetical protein
VTRDGGSSRQSSTTRRVNGTSTVSPSRGAWSSSETGRTSIRTAWVGISGGRGVVGALPQVVSSCWCAAAGVVTLLVRCLGWRWVWSPRGPRPGGWQQRRVGHSGCGSRGTQGSAFVRETPRLLRFLRDPVTNAEAFDLRRAKEESWVPFASGWAALLPSRGTVHEKGEALTRLTPPAVDMPPVERSEGGRSTDGTQKRRSLSPSRVQPAARDPRPARSPTARSRPSRNAAPRGAAPTQPHPNEEPHRRSRRSSEKPRRRSPTSSRSRADAAPPEGEPTPTHPQVEGSPTLTRARRRSP